jgi:hypothetical protein
MSKQRIPYKKVVVKPDRGSYVDRLSKALDVASKDTSTPRNVRALARRLMGIDNGY